jgi:hypothetical protein
MHWWQSQSWWPSWAQLWWERAQWLFFVPGDAFIAYVGPTELGASLNLTQVSAGSPAAAGLSAGLWLAIFCAAFWLIGLVQDVVDPTYRQQRREARQARARAQRDQRMRIRIDPYATGPTARIEPTLSPMPEVETEVIQRPKRASAGGR